MVMVNSAFGDFSRNDYVLSFGKPTLYKACFAGKAVRFFVIGYKAVLD
jgi:hypothetical protein